MLNISFKLASREDNEELLSLMAEMPMPGFVKIAYRREPDFFEALKVEGKTSQVILARDMDSGKAVGMGCRSIKPAFINGQKTNVGYLSSLRVLPAYRGTIHLAKGYDVFKQLHDDGKAKLYLSTILSDNTIAKKLIKPRRRLPSYRDLGQFRSMAISMSRMPDANKIAGLDIRTATIDDLPALIKLLSEQVRCRQFFPAYTEDDFTSNGLLRGISLNDIYLAFINGKLFGVVAGWDQKTFRQSVVAGYDRKFACMRPLYNLWARTTGRITLPPAGSALNYFYLSIACVKGNDRKIFLNLLSQLMKEKRKYSFMMAGMHESDPLLDTLVEFRHTAYLSRLCAVLWEDGEGLFNSLDGRTPYLELGSL